MHPVADVESLFANPQSSIDLRGLVTTFRLPDFAAESAPPCDFHRHFGVLVTAVREARFSTYRLARLSGFASGHRNQKNEEGLVIQLESALGQYLLLYEPPAVKLPFRTVVPFKSGCYVGLR
jgi:hypothetical protein